MALLPLPTSTILVCTAPAEWEMIFSQALSARAGALRNSRMAAMVPTLTSRILPAPDWTAVVRTK
jgi:hypothetical protein